MTESSNPRVPVLPLRDMVVYPHGVHPLFVGTPASIQALDAAMTNDKQIFLVAKRAADQDAASADDAASRVALFRPAPSP